MSWHRQSWHHNSLAEGPPRFLRFLLVLFVTIGSLVVGVWFATHETSQGESREGGQQLSLHR